MAGSKVRVANLVCLNDLKQRCPKSNLNNFRNFVQKRDQYVTRLTNLAESGYDGQLPTIDWDFYKRNVRSEAVPLVENFEKKYTSLIMPYPVDKYTAKLEKIKRKIRKEVKVYVDDSNSRIEKYNREIERIKALLPFNQMSWEEFIDAYPKDAPDFINKPTFWPHDPTEQLGYVDTEDVSKSQKGKKKK